MLHVIVLLLIYFCNQLVAADATSHVLYC